MMGAEMTQSARYGPAMAGVRNKDGQECKMLAEQATDCLLDYLYGEPKALVEDSAVFLLEIRKIWQQHGVDESAIWQELSERIDLSSDLLKRGIRARKGGRYRSTKLP
ncbi:hypothetical protein CO583_03960 [Parasaccharibacter sp. TMW2.1882]|uniref:Uncharacterized protein n=5 Tax=Acetobacterales TaxID=3120395 RepID=A0ABX4ZP17_9PROT|nr:MULTISPECIES: hypothetical protein [Acetobacteraceae]MCL1514483.1 hypothetical protein [Parasaccharibacter sp. TMW2.1890]MCL1562230.1 hypothetical protein [Parasaccharibacter sp. TMW 2.1886]MCQ0042326.1 hypothetical protein [Bombella sp.]MUG78983.1 hypothetical protein [Bombella sp. ESL0380]QGT74711.1 hypothetical protein GN304_02320 [Bombella sp. ESL0368]